MTQRLAFPREKRQQSARSALEILLAAPLFFSSNRIACYLAQNGEMECRFIIEAIWKNHKICYLPVLSLLLPSSLEFVSYKPDDRLKANRYKILEPDNNEKLSPEQLDLVIVPLVGFDEWGNRLGMGGGYYDRTFSFLKKNSCVKPYLLGLGFESQKIIDRLPVDNWDVPLNGVLTEEKIYHF